MTEQDSLADDRYFFLKFGEEEHLRELVEDGCVYFNTPSCFKNGEGVGGRSDPDEFIGFYYQSEDVLSLQIDDEEFALAGPLKLGIGGDDYTHLFSLTAIRLAELANGAIYNERSWEEFGDFLVLIHKPDEFIRRIEKNLEALGRRQGLCAVEYVNPDIHSGKIGPFRKFNGYSWQQEVRFVLSEPDQGGFKIPIGDISDIAHGPIHKSKCFNQICGTEIKI